MSYYRQNCDRFEDPDPTNGAAAVKATLDSRVRDIDDDSSESEEEDDNRDDK